MNEAFASLDVQRKGVLSSREFRPGASSPAFAFAWPSRSTQEHSTHAAHSKRRYAEMTGYDGGRRGTGNNMNAATESWKLWVCLGDEAWPELYEELCQENGWQSEVGVSHEEFEAGHVLTSLVHPGLGLAFPRLSSETSPTLRRMSCSRQLSARVASSSPSTHLCERHALRDLVFELRLRQDVALRRFRSAVHRPGSENFFRERERFIQNRVVWLLRYNGSAQLVCNETQYPCLLGEGRPSLNLHSSSWWNGPSTGKTQNHRFELNPH